MLRFSNRFLHFIPIHNTFNSIQPLPENKRSPMVTMTSPTPINSQDDDQATTTILPSNHLSPPTNITPSVDHISSPPSNGANPKAKHHHGHTPTIGGQRSPRIRDISCAPTPAMDITTKCCKLLPT